MCAIYSSLLLLFGLDVWEHRVRARARTTAGVFIDRFQNAFSKYLCEFIVALVNFQLFYYFIASNQTISFYFNRHFYAIIFLGKVFSRHNTEFYLRQNL